MFVNVKLDQNYLEGTAVCYNETTEMWTSAIDSSALFGIIQSVMQNEQNEFFGKVVFAGNAKAIAGSNIPDQGGQLDISNGRAVVNSGMSHCGIIAPLASGQSSRIEGDLVMVHIR